MLVLTMTLSLACFGVGLVIGLRCPDEWLALFVAVLLVTLGSAIADPVTVIGDAATYTAHLPSRCLAPGCAQLAVL